MRTTIEEMVVAEAMHPQQVEKERIGIDSLDELSLDQHLEQKLRELTKKGSMENSRRIYRGEEKKTSYFLPKRNKVVIWKKITGREGRGVFKDQRNSS